MTAAIAQKLEAKATTKWRFLLAFGITDETFSVTSFQNEKVLSRYYSFGLNTVAFASWNLGTWIGLFFADGFPDLLKSSMGIALYAMFIGLLVPQIKRYRPALIVSSLAVIINCLYTWLPITSTLSSGWGIILATVVSAAIGAKFCALEETE